MSVLKRAKIYDPQKPGEGFYVQFNPNSLDYSAYTNKKAYKMVRGKDDADNKTKQSSPTDYGDMANLSVRLFFHSYESELVYSDVRADVNRIRAFLRPPTSNEQSGTNNSNAVTSSGKPKIGFAWGTLVFVGSLEGFQVSFQMFAADGTPVQAEISILINGEDQEITAVNKEHESEVAYKNNNDNLQQSDQNPPPDTQWLFD